MSSPDGSRLFSVTCRMCDATTILGSENVARLCGECGLPIPPKRAESTALPAGLYDDVKVVALRLALTVLGNDDEAVRQAALQSELIGINEASPGLAIGIIGYLLAHFTDALQRGYGSRAAAVDEVTRELAAATLAGQGGQS